MSTELSKHQVINFDPGKLLIKEGDTSRKMFIIRKGQVRVYRNYFGKKITLAILGPGEVCGELSFFDAEPRSASCECLSDVEAIVVDGEKNQKGISELPSWVASIFRSVFHRFRELDQKITVLQSMNDFQKSTFQKDTVAQAIYMELLRFNKLFTMVYEKMEIDTKEKIEYKTLTKLMDELSGKKYLNIAIYFKMLRDQNLIDENLVDSKGLVKINFERIEEMNRYMSNELDTNRCLMLSHSAIAILRALLGYLASQESELSSVQVEKLKLYKMPFAEKAIKELCELKILVQDREDECLIFNFDEISQHFIFQSIIKAFDHSTIA